MGSRALSGAGRNVGLCGLIAGGSEQPGVGAAAGGTLREGSEVS